MQKIRLLFKKVYAEIRKKSWGRYFNGLVLWILACLVCAPVILTVLASLKSNWELTTDLVPVLTGEGKRQPWKLLPFYPTLHHYIKLLFQTPQFFVVFWNSVKIVAVILVGQVLISIPAGWAFACFSFRGKRLLLVLYVILMLMPFQVTMLPSYLVFQRLGILDTQSAVILPAIFSTFPVFILYRGFTAIPKELLEAARIDGAGEYTVFFRIGLPLGIPGILSALVLGFLEYWNLIEQPLAFIRDKTLWPLSIYLPQVDSKQAGNALAASVIALIPAYFVFRLGQDYMEQGIVSTGIK